MSKAKTPPFRTCKTCQATLPKAEFRNARFNKNGFDPECRACRKKRRKSSPKNALWGVYGTMRQRCENSGNPKYHRYGGRGICVCDEWVKEFESFYLWAMANGYERGLQIDRRDNDGNYTPMNCRFVTAAVNTRNQSTVKLNEELVREIRRRLSNGEQGKSLAIEFGVGVNAISDIKLWKTWK